VKDHRSCCTGTHDLLPSPLSGEAWALMQSSLTVFWVWDTSQVSGWQNDRVQPTHPAPTLEKRRPSGTSSDLVYRLQGCDGEAQFHHSH
jgi:hypothetical protein